MIELPKIDANTAYRRLGLAAGPTLEALGFIAAKGGRAWSRGEPKGTLLLDFQTDRNGFMPWGGQFTLNLIREDPSGRCLSSGRYWTQGLRVRGPGLSEPEHQGLLEKDEAEFLRLQNAILEKLPPSYDYDTLDLYQPLTDVGTDPWMRYALEPDLDQWWAQFLGPRIERILLGFAHRGDQD
jgi:hypothetical protein